MLSATLKKKIIREHARFDGDTGSPEVQASLLTENINQLQAHFGVHKKDHAGRKGLIRMVHLRRRLLDYLKDHDFSNYTALIKKLGLRR